jgi:DNA processing protein
MTTAAESAALVALLRLGRRPWPEYSALLEETRSARGLLEQELAGTGNQATLLPQDPEPQLAQAAADIDRWRAAGIQLITVLDDGYPTNLKAVHDRPPVIFVNGRLAAADSRAIAVIGSRRASQAGLHQAQAISEHLVQAGFTVASGLAAGIDTAAHTTALKANGRTLAVIGTGLNHSYPPQNQALQTEIAQRCAVISQFWPDAPPSRDSFPLRNATMSGLAMATVVVEASNRSGARIQARRALAHGRPVFLARPTLDERWARELAQRPAVYVFDDPAQITAAVNRLTDPGALIG